MSWESYQRNKQIEERKREGKRLINELLKLDNILLLVESTIKQQKYLFPEKREKDLLILDDLREETTLFKEIWHEEYNPNLSNSSQPFLAFVDSKGIMRYKFVLDFYEVFYISEIKKTFEIKRIISNEELINKTGLKKENFIIESYKNHGIYYVDENEAFAFRSESFLPEEKFVKVNGKLDPNFDLLHFDFSYDQTGRRGRIEETNITGTLDLNTLEVLNVNNNFRRYGL